MNTKVTMAVARLFVVVARSLRPFRKWTVVERVVLWWGNRMLKRLVVEAARRRGLTPEQYAVWKQQHDDLQQHQ
jgi:hypothetical protein